MTEKTAGSEIQPEENLNHIESPQKSDEAKAETIGYQNPVRRGKV